MEDILNQGIQIILFLQNLGSWLLGPMKFFSFLGQEEFYLLVAPVLFWCIDPGLGLRAGVGLMISSGVNACLKLGFNDPRPYWLHPGVQTFAAETSFGAPSGHAQNAVVVWGIIAAWVRKTWFWIVAVIVMFMIGLSRMYLGVHFPSDVVIGWIVGAILLWTILRFEKPLLSWFQHHSTKTQILLVLGASLAIILVGASVRLILGDWRVPEEWIQLAGRAPDSEPINPLALSGLISNAGVFFGLSLGGILLWKRGWFDAGGFLWKRIVRYLIGVIGVVVIWYGLGAVFPRGEALFPYILRYFRYGLVGFWVAYLGPLLFIRLKLANPAAPKSTPV